MDITNKAPPNRLVHTWFLCLISASSLREYPTGKSPRGLCLIINNIAFKDPEDYRKGAEIDQKSVKALFKELDFTVKEYTNLTQHQMENKFNTASEKTDHTNYDIFVSVVMSHGGAQDRIYGSDGNYTTVERLMASFLPSKCPSLSGKPKLFFFQSCRGPGEQTQAPQPGESKAFDWCADSTLSSTTFPHEADFLLAFSTPPGYVAYRSECRGSTYIQTLVDVIKEYHCTTHVLDMLTEVNQRVAEEDNRQIPAVAHTLTAKVYF